MAAPAPFECASPACSGGYKGAKSEFTDDGREDKPDAEGGDRAPQPTVSPKNQIAKPLPEIPERRCAGSDDVSPKKQIAKPLPEIPERRCAGSDYVSPKKQIAKP